MKKFLFSLIMFATMITPLVLTSCDDDSETIDKPKEDKELAGTISEVRNLDKSVEYLLTGPVIIAVGVTLNVPAGTVI